MKVGPSARPSNRNFLYTRHSYKNVTEHMTVLGIVSNGNNIDSKLFRATKND